MSTRFYINHNTPSVSFRAAREEHVKLKYRSKHFCKFHPLKGDQAALNEVFITTNAQFQYSLT